MAGRTKETMRELRDTELKSIQGGVFEYRSHQQLLLARCAETARAISASRRAILGR